VAAAAADDDDAPRSAGNLRVGGSPTELRDLAVQRDALLHIQLAVAAHVTQGKHLLEELDELGPALTPPTTQRHHPRKQLLQRVGLCSVRHGGVGQRPELHVDVLLHAYLAVPVGVQAAKVALGAAHVERVAPELSELALQQQTLGQGDAPVTVDVAQPVCLR
jgi:hypothetical protein